MTEKESKLLQDFEEKVLQLTSMYNLLEENYKKLENTNSELKNQISELQEENG
jgi:predicted nuclease with TOPRIM domain